MTCSSASLAAKAPAVTPTTESAAVRSIAGHRRYSRPAAADTLLVQPTLWSGLIRMSFLGITDRAPRRCRSSRAPEAAIEIRRHAQPGRVTAVELRDFEAAKSEQPINRSIEMAATGHG